MGNDSSVYLDYAATTPVDPIVAKSVFACLTEAGEFGNASSATHLKTKGRYQYFKGHGSGFEGIRNTPNP